MGVKRTTRTPRRKHSNEEHASTLLLEWEQKFTDGSPILDAGCGTGRNAMALAKRGANIVCADRDLTRLHALVHSAQGNSLMSRIDAVCAQLEPDRWPFGNDRFGGIICVHFFDVRLLPHMRQSLCRNGHLYVETAGGQGGNYRELPLAGTLLDLLSPDFRLLFYKERPVGPPNSGKCAVKLLAEKVV